MIRPALVYAPFNFIAPPHWRAIVKLVALKHRVGTKDILSSTRTRRIARARQEAMHLVYNHCGHGCIWVGERFDRDHTTVLHAIRKRLGMPLHGGHIPSHYWGTK